MVVRRVPSGIDGLDAIIEGGLPKAGLFLLAGNPGTGKTVFSARFLYRGIVDYGENGVYVSFAENKKAFYEMMNRFGFNFERLEGEGRFKFLDMVSVREEGISPILKVILGEVERLEAKRLVIDSFSAMAQTFKEPIDVRIILHTVLSRITRQTGCTTLIIVEVPFGEERMGLGIEEFVADGVLYLQRDEFDEMLLRELTILKLRGTKVPYPKAAFTLEGGFQVFLPIILEGIEEPKSYEIIPHSEDCFSTGIKDLDDILKGMVRRGNYDLLEVERDVAFPLERMIRPVVCNFLNQGYGVVILPPAGITALTIRDSLRPYVDDETLKQNLRVVSYRVEGEGKPREEFIIPLTGASIEKDFTKFWEVCSGLKEKTGKPVLSIVGYDTVEYTYGEMEALKILGEDLARIRNFGDLRLNIIRPTIQVADQLRALANIHMKVNQIDGALFLHGIKPRTPLLNVSIATEKGVSRVKLTPIT